MQKPKKSLQGLSVEIDRPPFHSYTLTHTITSTSGRTLHHNNNPKLPTSLAGSLTHPHHFGSGAAVLGGPVAVVAG